MQFTVQQARGVHLAILEINRPLTIIVGPNGSGKSTVLNQIRQQTFGQHIYIGPHRATRRQTARLRFMGNHLPSMSDLMSSQNLGGYEGVTTTATNRDAWELDEAANFFKYNLSKIEFQRASAISRLFDSEGAVVAGRVPDVWSPLKELTANLLPHLTFSRIETDNYDNMRCLFHVHQRATEVDFDDLSSGEKAVLQTLYPIIELQVMELLKSVAPNTPVPSHKSHVIFDEPELHLHPSLQEKLVSYLRAQAIRRSMHVILATHSPTIIDAADQDNILLLRSIETVNEGENQIAALGDDPQRLTFVQEVIGSVFPVTAARPLLLIEGQSRVTVKSYSDKQIYISLDPRFLRLNILPQNGKDECLRALASSREILRDQPFGLRVFALLDRDLEEEDSPAEGAFHLPVCMVENLLLSIAALRAGFGPILHQTPFQDDEALRAALEQSVSDVKEAEIHRRFRRKVRYSTFGPGRGAIDAVSAHSYRRDFKAMLDQQDFDQMQQDATDEVNGILERGEQLNLFSGKNIINAFYQSYVSSLGMSKPIFVYGAAAATSDNPTLTFFLDDLFSKIL